MSVLNGKKNVVTGTYARVYLKSALFLLTFTALGKLAMGAGRAAVLSEPSPLFGFVSNRQLLFAAAGLELAVVFIALLRGVGHQMATVSIAWLATMFLGYRLTLWMSGFRGYCDCLGSLSGALGLTPKEGAWIATATLAYILAGTYCLLIKGRFVCPRIEES